MKATKSHDRTRQAKAARRARRKHEDRRAGLRLRPLGGEMDPIVLRRTIDAFSSIDMGGPWADLSPRLLPLLKRVSHPYPAEMSPAQLLVPPGVWVGFGVDVGPAWAHVTPTLIEDWGIDDATLLGTALDNLRRRVAEEPPQVEHAVVDGTPLTVVQAQGWGSALILAPDRLGPLIGPEPGVVLTPIRNALVVLPEDVGADVAVAVWGGLAEGCHDELDVGPLHWTGNEIRSFAEDVVPLVH